MKILYPITPYHLFLSGIYFNDDINYIIIDEEIFEKKIIENIRIKQIWKLLIIKKYNNKLLNNISRLIFYKIKLTSILKIKGASVVFYSYGNSTCNMIVNKMSRNNHITEFDDGIAPYWMTNLKLDWTSGIALEKSSWMSRFAYKLKSVINSNIIPNHEVANKHITLKKNMLSQELLNSHDFEEVSKTNFKDTFVDSIFNVGDLNYGKVKYLYFDSVINEDISSEYEIYIISELFKNIDSDIIYIKLRKSGINDEMIGRKLLFRRIEKNINSTLKFMEPYDIPWEMVYKNTKGLEDTIFITSSITTALFTPYLIWNREHTTYICSKLFVGIKDIERQHKLYKMVDRLQKLYRYKKIYFPESMDNFKKELLRNQFNEG